MLLITHRNPYFLNSRALHSLGLETQRSLFARTPIRGQCGSRRNGDLQPEEERVALHLPHLSSAPHAVLTHSSQRHACWWSPQHLWREFLKWEYNHGVLLALHLGHPNNQLPKTERHISNPRSLVFINISRNIRQNLFRLYYLKFNYSNHDKDFRQKNEYSDIFIKIEG